MRFTTPRFSGRGSPLAMLSSRRHWLLKLSSASPLAPPRSGLERSDFVRWVKPRRRLIVQTSPLLPALTPPPRHSRSRASGLRQMLSLPPAPPILWSSGDGPHRVKFWFSFAAGIFQNNRTRSSRNSMPPLKRLISTNNRRAFEHMSRLYD